MSNWYIDRLVVGKLHEHEQKGWFNSQDRMYLGNTTRLKDIHVAFEQLVPTLEMGSRKLFVRRSCIDGLSNKYTVVGLYLSNKPPENTRTVHHVSWLVPGRINDVRIMETIHAEFETFLQRNNFSPVVPQFTEGFPESDSLRS